MNGVTISLWLCAAIAVVVFATMIIGVVKFNGSLNGSPSKYLFGKTTEILWALVPIAIMSATAISAVRMSVLAN